MISVHHTTVIWLLLVGVSILVVTVSASWRNTVEVDPIAKRGFLLSRGHRADLATTRPKRLELWPGSRAELSFKTVYNTFENRRMHQCWWGGCGHVMALHSMPAEWAKGFGSGCAHSWRQSHRRSRYLPAYFIAWLLRPISMGS